MRVLIVKLSSMGDLIQALPALTDAQQAIPNIQFDWVVDEAFAEIPELHPTVNKIIKSAHRRWSKNKWSSLKNGELATFWHDLRAHNYDIVLDAQNNLKSAIVTRCSKGLRVGMDKASVRERGAHLAYQKTVAVAGIKDEHAITRMRRLFAQILNYAMPQTNPEHHIDINKIPDELPITLPNPYLVFMHSTTWDNKHWPEHYWVDLIKRATSAGYHVVLPWGSQKEHDRSQRLALTAANATVLPRLSIKQQARVMLNSAGNFTLDTGLGHLAAALDVPTIHLYGPTDPNLLGVFTPHQQYLTPAHHCTQCYLRECKYGQEAECFSKGLTPQMVWDRFIEQQ